MIWEHEFLKEDTELKGLIEVEEGFEKTRTKPKLKHIKMKRVSYDRVRVEGPVCQFGLIIYILLCEVRMHRIFMGANSYKPSRYVCVKCLFWSVPLFISSV